MLMNGRTNGLAQYAFYVSFLPFSVTVKRYDIQEKIGLGSFQGLSLPIADANKFPFHSLMIRHQSSLLSTQLLLQSGCGSFVLVVRYRIIEPIHSNRLTLSPRKCG